MDREKRNKLVQDYIDIRVFLESVKQLKSKATKLEEKEESEVKDEEVLEQVVD